MAVLPRFREPLTALLLAVCFGGFGCVPAPAELVVANGADVEVLDPQIATSTAAGRVFAALFAGLTRLDPETLEVIPDLASSWTKEDAAGTVWTFHLRPDLRWSDGSALTAEDVVASWKRLASPATGATYSGWLKGAEILASEDGQAVRIHFQSPQPLFDRMCAYHALAPIPKVLREASPGRTPRLLPCSGPYRLVERRIRDRIRVTANPHHWSGLAPGFSTIDFLTLDAQFTALNLFLAEDVQYAPNVPDLAVPALLRDHGDVFAPTPQFATYFLRFQLRDSPFRDRDLRLALIHAIDRDALVRNLGGSRPPAAGLVPPLVEGYPSSEGPGFDLGAARAALSRYRAKHPGPLPYLEYLYPSSDLNRALAEVLQQQWSEHLGVEVALANQESKTFFPRQRALEYQVSHSSWVGDYLDPQTFLENFVADSGNNRTGFADQDYADLLRWASECGDPMLRLELLAQAEQMLLQEAVVLPLLLDVGHELVSPDLQGFHRNAAGIIDWSALSPKPRQPEPKQP
ncbi:MAG: peptide ABC transporter substrate-binding protein [Planctomycetota bacterium]